MRFNPNNKAIILSLLLTLFFNCHTQAQTNTEIFGQNRVQYRKFDWKYFETKHFRIYHYDRAGRMLARYVAEQVENDIAVIEQKMEGEFPRKFSVILYNNFDEYTQTNIGGRYESQLRDIPAGTIDVVGDKLVVYFTGVHTDLRRQTREGMAKVIMERMMYGENFREVVKNALLLNLPKWVLYGYTSYLIEGWDAKTHTDWKNLLAANPKSSFYDLSADHYEIAGKAFWKYISDRYGDNNMKTLLFNMQTKGNYNQSVKQTLGQTPRLVSDSILGYFNRMYEKDELQREAPDTTKTKLVVDLPTDGSIIQSFKVAPKGNDVAYVSWKNGEYKVYMQSTLGPQARYAILEEGKPDYAAQPDPNYPLLAWSNSGYKLAVLYRKNNKNMLRVYNSLKARVENYVIPNNRFDRALGMTFNEDDDRLVFSAIKKSQTDLYEFVIRGARMNNITNDEWDDIQPWFVSGGSKRGILFLSNRPKGNLNVPVGVNELPTGPMNVFFYNTKTKRKELLQMSNVKEGNISQPIQYGSEHFAYLYDINGVQNQYIVTLKRDKNNMETPVATAVTNYSRNIISHQYNPASRQAADVMQVGNQYIVYYRPLQYPGVNVEAKNPERTTLLQSERDRVKITRKPGESLLKGGDVFQSEFKDDGSEATTQATPDGIAVPAGEADSTYLKMRAQPYRTSFKLDFFTIKLDNSLLFNRYQPAELNGGVFQSPPIGGMLTASLNDLMENHRLTGGVRLPLNFTGLTYFLQYENFKRRLDWGLLYLRSVTYKNELIGINIPPNPTIYSEQMLKTTMNIVQATANYPLDHIRSIRLQGSFRSDKLVLKSQDIIGLTAVPVDGTQNWGILRAEYVFDNTKKPIINIYNGFRYKFFGEYYARVNGPGGGMFSVGTDFRYYAKIYRNFIWAVRAAAATSDGKYKILYHVGGVDNWFANRKYSDYVPVRPYENYGLETIVTSLRGYELNSRNGNSYTVLNSEFRLPLVTTFIKRPIQSSILKNLQAVAFVDAGAAWEGIWPNADRLKNDRILPDPNGGQASNVTLIISDETAGLGVGYGAGLRTMLFGYFFRVDAAWNIDGRTKPLWHLGVGTDF
jgi:hypothetical protein